ncbi:TPA: bifunctional uridylyltransferase/uridylyl-removing protein GlnD [Neisseria gonorrhoeae]
MPENLSSALETFKQQRNAAEAHYLKANRVSVFFREYTAAVETLLAALWAEHFQNSALCLMAVGGFGRGEPYPCSDVDLAVVSPVPLSDGIQEQIARFIQTLWDCKLMPSVKSGSVDELCESVRDDITGDTAFLEARFLFGNRQTADELAEKMNVQRNVAAFIEAKLVEMEHRHAKSQGSGAVLEPNIKSCPGGLRDIHTLLWIAKAQGLAANLPDLLKQRILTRAEAGMLSHGYRRLAHIRIRLHLNAKRAEDRLLFDLQPQVAESMGYQDENRRRQSEELMRVFYRAVKTVKQLGGILTPMLRSRVSSTPMRVTLRIDDDYIQVNNQIAARHTDIFFRRPEHIFKIVEIMQQRNDITALEPQTLRAWWGATRKINRSFYQNSENRRRFAGFFRSGNGLTQTLRFLNLYGVLGRYLPAWEKIVGLLQHDLFHIYPVDDHILAVVRNVRRLALDMHSHELPYASALMQSFEKQDILYLAAFFHDIAKGRGGDHAVQGIADARQFAADHFLTEEESDANLVHDFEPPIVRSRILPQSDSFQVMVFMPNGPRLFARLCRIFSRHGFDILAARAFITEHDYILDTFIVQIPSQHAPEDYPDIQSALEAELNSFIHGHTVAETQSCNRRISRRSRYMPIAPSITITPEEDYPDRYSVEITAVNRPFLLADMAEVFFAHNVSLRYAKISTLDERVEDSFTVFSPDLKNPKIQSSLKQALLEQLA